MHFAFLISDIKDFHPQFDLNQVEPATKALPVVTALCKRIFAHIAATLFSH
ncbi:hypothetical protein LPB67_09415 [Undibacterium sp. Jales W-56]|uniref:hypothetical protein n=1 Tax=Undibacterium sp. Jales W-56 TaxID=2897325 RepID=UPI0021D34D95|nr:hypothetical protein [Undibacterium sp. Jales W-56]MCU6433983.1 hypothetical protein [Undibacterium sp. Jales W-56]